MIKAFPHLISRSCFVDPVTFCLWEGDVCYNFFYKTLTTVSMDSGRLTRVHDVISGLSNVNVLFRVFGNWRRELSTPTFRLVCKLALV